MLLTGLARIQGDTGDTRLINYILEHGYRWLVSMPGHKNLWNPAFFYPIKNTLAYSDTLLGVLPFYVIWRILGIQPDTAFQLWWLTISSLNYVAFYFFLRSCFRLTPLASASGSFLFSFGGPQVAQVGHQQLFAHFYIVVGIYALVRVFQINQDSTNPKKPIFWIPVFFGCLIAQIYAGFYFGWFFLLSLGVALLWAILIPSYRVPLLSLLRNQIALFTISLLFSVVALIPMISHYLAAAKIIGYPDSSQVSLMTPRLYSWIYSGPFSWLYKWMFYIEPFKSLYMDQEHRLGLGFVTSIVVLYGLYYRRNHTLVHLLIIISITIFLSVTMFPFGLSLWRFISEIIPGAKAIRAVARIGILLLIPASLGLAFFIQRAQSTGATWIALIIIIVCVLEQGETTPSFNKYSLRSHIKSISEKVNPDCKAFLYAPYRALQSPKIPLIVWNIKNNIDAMWAQVETGIPTINGYSGYNPPGWSFSEVNFQSQEDKQTLKYSLSKWCNTWNLDLKSICWIETPVDSEWSRDNLLSYLIEKHKFIQRLVTYINESSNPYVRKGWVIIIRYLHAV
jgi:hypothetical protein